jgi:acetoin utilization deacetylase AcuC-like enzyme
MKQTSIEWLHETAKQRELDKFDWEDAKNMHKQEIVSAINDAWNMAKHSNFYNAQAEQYYNETYKGGQDGC